ncbi:hypothetical protein AEAC466_08750 [Asticcacaulis sp. AC466]|nr:hypothetical protein AEAC466_08750 [Asticcacaulis sp. AC466]
MPTELDAHMHTLRKRYLETMSNLLTTVEAALRHCEDGSLDADGRVALGNVAHRLSGTGKTYGFPRISASAREIDVRLKERPDMPARELMELIYSLVVACRNALGRDEIRGVSAQRVSFGRRPPSVATTPQQDVPNRPVMLVVDDDPDMRDLFTGLFSHEARVLTAVNSDEALVMMRRHNPSLVLLDDIMPGAITGLKFLETLQTSGEFRGTPIVMITASDAPENIERGMNAGAAGYITKPFDVADATEKVRRFLKAVSQP